MTCLRPRIRADELEQAVINHFAEAAQRAGYFKMIEGKLSEEMKSEPTRIEDEMIRAKEALSNIEKEIAATFRFQLQSNGGAEAAQLTAQHLEKLGRDKKIVMNRVLELEELEHSRKDASELCKVIELNIKEFKRCFHKASPSTKRRLLKKIIWKLVYRPNGLDTYFNVDEGGTRSLPITEAQTENLGKILPLKQKKQPAAALNLSFEFLPVEGIGWGTWTRTME